MQKNNSRSQIRWLKNNQRNPTLINFNQAFFVCFRQWESRDRKFHIDFFFEFLGVFHRFSINIRIAVHFLSFVLGNEKTPVACKSLLRASQDLHMTSVLSFPNANENRVLQSLMVWIYFFVLSALNMEYFETIWAI